MRQYGNFVALKSGDTFQFRNHFLEAVGSIVQDEIEIRRIIDDGVLGTQCLKQAE